MLEASAIKNMVTELGADLCGIAPVERFAGAPEGFHPGDVFIECKSVLVFAKRLPAGTLLASSCVPYTLANKILMGEIDLLGYDVSLKLEDLCVKTVIIPTDDPSEYWEVDRQYARGILSLRHAGYLAGLGVLGRNTLLKERQVREHDPGGCRASRYRTRWRPFGCIRSLPARLQDLFGFMPTGRHR